MEFRPHLKVTLRVNGHRHEREIDARTTLGWTPYMVANHVFASNVERSWPDTAAYIRQLAEERGIFTDDVPVELNVTAPSSGK